MLVNKNIVILVITVIITYFDTPCLGYHLLPTSNGSLIRNRRQSDCRTKFQCGSGECVFFYEVCDGRRDCSDGSDETDKQCKDVNCSNQGFRCSYGACIDKDYRCNEQEECADGSDEDPTICGRPTVKSTTPTSPLTNDFCPAISLINGQVTVLGQAYVPGTPVPNYALIQLTCNNNFTLYPANAFINCVNGSWNIAVPECKYLFEISSSVDVTHEVDSKEMDFTKPLVEATVVTKVPHISNDFCPAVSLTNGQVTVLGHGYVPGTPVPNSALVQLTCNNYFTLDPANALINCVNGEWNIAVPQCKNLFEISSSVDVTHEMDSKEMDLTKPLSEATIVTKVSHISNDFCPAVSLTNGQVTVLRHGYVPGTPVTNYALVQLTCNNNFTLYPANAFINCVNGSWNIAVPECKLTCSPRTSSSVDVTCKVDSMKVDCTKPMVEGTVAISTCKYFYTQSGNEIPISTCSGGSWDIPLIRCNPECGEKVSVGTTNIVNSTNAKKGEFPWHIALYRLINGIHEYQCGGSIITPLVIITAAHCFTDEYGSKYPAREYFIGAGKYYSDYNSPDDRLAQTRQIKEYHLPPQYRASLTNYAGDLALAVVEKILQMSNLVQPVCVDWDNKIEEQQLTANNRGSVVGWGYVDPYKPTSSAELKQLNAPYIDVGQCFQVVPQNFLRWVTPDKFCAGFTNGSSVCRGDSGGGMVFGWKNNNREKFYIRGLVSVGPLNKGVCDNFQYGVYTKVSFYLKFILEIIGQNQALR